LGDKIKNNVIGEACSIYGRQERCIQGFGGENVRERNHLGDLGVDGRIIVEWILKKVGWGGMHWIELTQDRGRWRALVEAAMNFRMA
jgi:hypothetical protein